MGILSRCRDILASNINALLDKAEDPAKMVDQYLIDAKKDLAECKQETAGVMAAEKQAKRDLDQCKAEVAQYADIARKALAAGDEGDARKALEIKQRNEAQLPQLQANYDSAHENAEMMRKVYDKLASDIQDLEARKRTVKGTVAAAKAQEAVNRVGARSQYGSAASEGMAKMERKAAERLDRASAMSELDMGSDVGSGKDLAAKYGAGGSSSVDAELAALKAEMAGPAASPLSPEIEAEMEKLKAELGGGSSDGDA